MGKHHRRASSLLPIASPLAGHRLTKQVGNLIAKCAEQKRLIYGVKHTSKLLKKKERGICILGGNVSPMDIITHLPAICERESFPYVFLPTKEQISTYAQRTMPVACVVVRPPEDDAYREEYEAVVAEIQALAHGPDEVQGRDE
jgi:H/ACA ribonucleoprotein complex subunit 2